MRVEESFFSTPTQRLRVFSSGYHSIFILLRLATGLSFAGSTTFPCSKINNLRSRKFLDLYQMASHITDNSIWQQLKSKSGYLNSQLHDFLRYRSLKPLEVDLCLLISSMFPEDSSIRSIEDLAKFEINQNLFEVRYIVHGLVDVISRCYVTKLRHEEDECNNQYVNLFFDGSAHDLATEIASRYRLVFCSENVMEKWHKTNWYCNGLSLVLKKTRNHPMTLECPRLSLLQLQHGQDSQSLPVHFFKGMIELRILSLDVPSLPQSLDALRNLQTLRLKVLKLEDMSWIGCLINLEFLSISTSSLTDISQKMRKLRNLRLLDLRKMNLGYIPQGVLSRMLKLEELYLPLSFVRWGCKATKEDNDYEEWELREDDDVDDGKRINASLCEIGSLSLKALEICVPNASVLPKKSLAFKKIQRFKILVPDNLKYRPLHKGSINELQLKGDACDIKESEICELWSRTEDLSLTRVRNLKNVNYFMRRQEDYELPRLKKMIITECEEVEYLVDTTANLIPNSSFLGLRTLHLSMLSNMKEIWHETRAPFGWFGNLRQINIRFCQKLKYVFPLSIVKGLKRLESIEILDCNEMEGILFKNEVDDINTYEVHFIETLHLHSLPKLIGFMVQQDTQIEVHDYTNQSLTTNEIVLNIMEGPISALNGSFQSFPTNESTSRSNECCTDDGELACPESTSKSRGKLQVCITQQLVSNDLVSFIKNKEKTSHMEMLNCAFSSKVAEKWLRSLKRLKISFCDALKVIFWFEKNHPTTRFNSLIELELYGLRNLMHIWFLIPEKLVAFQNLQLLVLSECQNLYLFSPRVAKLLVRLRKIYINRCEKMEEIFVNEDEEEVETTMDIFIFPQLKVLELENIPSLRIFYSGIHAIELPLLESLKLNECKKMKSFSCGSLSTPMLKSIQINGSSHLAMGDLNATMKRVIK